MMLWIAGLVMIVWLALLATTVGGEIIIAVCVFREIFRCVGDT